MANGKSTVFVKGKIYWAKIIGTPRANYENTGREWAYELEPDDTSFLKEHKLLDRLKDKYDDRGPFLTLRKPEFTKDGEKNEPIRIYDSENEAWDGRLIGNGSRVVAKLNIVDYGKGKKAGIYTTALRIEELVPYVSNEFGAMDDDDGPPARKAKTKQPVEDLDDDIPF